MAIVIPSNKYFPSPALFANGTLAAPSIAFSSEPSTGFYWPEATVIATVISGTAQTWTVSGGVRYGTNIISFGTGVNATDCRLQRDGVAGIFAFHNNTANAGAIRVFNTRTDVNNKEYVGFEWSGNVASLLTAKAGTGTLRGLNIQASGANLGFFGVTPVARAAAYTPTNVTTDRSYDANSTTTDELADVLGTLIADLQAYGLLQ